MRTQFLEVGVGFRQVFAVGAFALEEIRNGVETQSVHAHVQPELEHLQHGFLHRRALEIEVGLMMEKTVPVILSGHRVPRPVGRLEILEDDARILIFFLRVAPDVVIAFDRTLLGPARPLEPRVLVARVVDDEFRDDAQSPRVRFLQKRPEIRQRAVLRIDAVIIRDVVAVVAQRAGIKRQQPDRRDPQALQIVELGHQARRNRRCRLRCCRRKL